MRLGSVICMCALSAGLLVHAQSMPISTANRNSRIVAILGTDDDLTRRAAGKFSYSLWDRTRSRPEIRGAGAFKDQGGHSVVVFGWPEDATLSTILGPRPDMRDWKDDGYVLRVVRRGQSVYVAAAGKTPQGTKYAAYDLIRRLAPDGQSLIVPEVECVRNPLIGSRRVILGIPVAGRDDVFRQMRFCFENWDVPKIEEYVDLLDFLGFNAIEVSETAARRSWTGNHITPAQLTAKYAALCRRARLNGQSVTLFVGGHSNLAAGSFNTLCPNDPSERQLIMEEYDRLARTYAPIVNHVHVHWADPGGCRRNGCTIADPQRLTSLLFDKFRALNPAIAVSFSLWYLVDRDMAEKRGKQQPWAGYEGPQTVLNSGLLPKDVQIALPGARFDLDLARRLRANGRKVGVWSWYFADMETINGLHYHGRILDHDFDLLPKAAGDLIEWHTLDSVHHGMNLPTLWVGAQKLWDPSKRSSELLKEFSVGVFGSPMAQPVQDAYEAINKVRCGARSWKEDETFFFQDANPENVSCNLGKGTADPEQDLAVIVKAQTGLSGKEPVPYHRPNFPLIFRPDEMLTQLREHLALMEAYARWRVALQDIDRAERRGASPSELLSLFRTAESIRMPALETSFGALEAIYRYPQDGRLLDERKKRLLEAR